MAMTHGGNIFASAEQAGVAWQQMLDFSASINPLGPSPRVREAILASLDRIEHYPDKTSTLLRRRLAELWSLAPEQVLCGNGATDLLSTFCQVYTKGHLAAPCFNEFHRLWPQALICRLEEPSTWPRDGVLVITRPANPTGFLIDAEAVLRHVRESAATVLVDESFIDFTEAPSLVAATRTTLRLLVLRSLTKFYALPGLRVGALAAHPSVIPQLEARRLPWAVNALAEQAALAAMADTAHQEAGRLLVRQEREWLAARLPARPSQANYVYIETPRASQFAHYAAQRQVLVRDCTGWPGLAQPAIRIAVKHRWQNEILVDLWKEFPCSSR